MSALHFVDHAHSLSDRICHALQRQPHLVGRQVRCELRGEEVVLTGSVQTYFQKQMAQETLRHIPGISRIVNDLEVVRR
jgi:osmotically-inducible protein OsmY